MRPQDLATKLKDRGHHQAGDAIATLLLQIEELRAEKEKALKRAEFWQARCRRLEAANDHDTRAIPHMGRVS